MNFFAEIRETAVLWYAFIRNCDQAMIIIDHREKRSGIPELLVSAGAEIIYENLPAGDYRIEGKLLIERKDAEDYIVSLFSGRLFRQCRMLKKSSDPCLILIEGDIFRTNHKVSRQSLSGSLMGIMVSWQIPVYFSSGKEETADFIVKSASMIEKRDRNSVMPVNRRRRVFSSQLFFLQCLPGVGPSLATRLLKHFGSVSGVATAPVKDLTTIKGIGKEKAEKLFNFFRETFFCNEGF